MRLVWAVLLKELLDAVRDRRYFATALIMPLFLPGTFGLTLNQTIQDVGSEKKTILAVANPDRAPLLVEYLDKHGLSIEPAPDNTEAAVKGGEVDAVLVIPEDFSEQFRQGKTVVLPLIQDESRVSASRTLKKTRELIRSYAAETAGMRLLARGISPTLLQPVRVDDVNLASPEEKGSRMLEFLIMTMLMSAMMSNMYVATDVAAGERERRSLEPLLTTPASRLSLVAGKWLATAVFGIGGVLLTTLTSVGVLFSLPLENLGFRVVLEPLALSWAFILMVPLSLLGGALQLAISALSRSFKEAQIWQSLTLFLPMIPGFYFTFSPQDPAFWMMPIPVLGQHQLLSMLLQGDSVPAVWEGVSIAGSLALCLLCLGATHSIFSREAILVGK